MARVRRCDNRCHRAKGTKCRCWCGGNYHGSAGADNRAALQQAVDSNAQKELLEQHGFKPGETVFLHQPELPLEKEVK
ncbi:MAG: hypothetical protein PHI12_06580 [Dehalococcoidales bacterium]|nr:hypothetical protein [Dehalococcoidales bacterium]